MKLALAPMLFLFSIHTHATLFCYNSQSGVGMEWNAGKLTYTVGDTVVGNPGPQLMPWLGADAYCWADGPELLDLYTALPDVRFPAPIKNKAGVVTGFRVSIQPGASSTLYWTGDEALYIINNL